MSNAVQLVEVGALTGAGEKRHAGLFAPVLARPGLTDPVLPGSERTKLRRVMRSAEGAQPAVPGAVAASSS
jgi:hypothetical protein